MTDDDSLDPSSPGKPNTPRDTAVGIFAMGFVLVSLILLVPALVAAVPALVSGRVAEGDVVTLTIAAADALGLLVPSFRVVVSAFAVLMLTLFVEEGLRSTTADQAVRRNVALFASWGAVVTTAMSFAAVFSAAVDISRAGDAVITVGAGVVVLFFAAHLGTRGVVPLVQQKRAAVTSLDSALKAQAALADRPTCSPRGARWSLAAMVTSAWLAVPTLLAGVAAIPDTIVTPATWSAVGVSWAMLATLMGTFSFAALPDTPRVARAFALAALGLAGVLLTGLSVALAWLSYLDMETTPAERTVATLLAGLSAVLALTSLPWRKLPRFTLTALLWSIRARQVEKQVERAKGRVDELATAEEERTNNGARNDQRHSSPKRLTLRRGAVSWLARKWRRFASADTTHG